MKVRVLSDLHLEWGAFELKYYGEDLLILAGDISPDKEETKNLIVKYLEENKNSSVIFVAGNHDYYTSSVPKTDMYWRNLNINRFYFLQDSNVVIDGVCFHGATLWTDLKGVDPRMIERCINDYLCIDNFTTRISVALHMQSKKLISKVLDTKEKVVVITHHMPSYRSVHKKYHGSPLNASFASNLDDLVAKSHVWIHGHTHTSFQYSLGKCLVLCNPRGRMKGSVPENTDFLENKTFTI
jgi:predicted phosphodiesterase